MSEMSKICWKHFKIRDFDQDFDPLSNIDEIANSVGLGVLKKNSLQSANLPNKKAMQTIWIMNQSSSDFKCDQRMIFCWIVQIYMNCTIPEQ